MGRLSTTECTYLPTLIPLVHVVDQEETGYGVGH